MVDDISLPKTNISCAFWPTFRDRYLLSISVYLIWIKLSDVYFAKGFSDHKGMLKAFIIAAQTWYNS